MASTSGKGWKGDRERRRDEMEQGKEGNMDKGCTRIRRSTISDF